MFIKNIIQALNKQHVKYAVVGGYAVALHGAVRGTIDIDLVLYLEKAQFVGAEKALQALGLEPRLPVSAAEVFEFRQEYIDNRNLIAWRFYNPRNPLEIVDIVLTHDLAQMNTITKTIEGLSIQLASLDDLIAMKRQSARPQDLEDIKALEKLR